VLADILASRGKMKLKRLSYQVLAVTLILSLTLGCRFLGSMASTPDPNQEFVNAAIQDAQSVTVEQADQAEVNMVSLLRDHSGARAAFGDQADAIFLKIDQDKSAALDEMLNQAMGEGSPLKVSALMAKTGILGTTRASPHYMTNSMVEAFIILLTATQLANLQRDNNENAIGELTDGGDPVGAVGTLYTFQPTLVGSRLEARGTITTTRQEPFPYEESIEYDLIMDICPDAEGNVPIQLSIHSAASLLGGGVQMGVEGQVTGHVNDEGTLASRDFKSTYQGARQPIHGVGENLGTTNNFFEYQENVTLYTNPENTNTGSGDFTRQSSDTDQQFNHDAIQEMRLLNLAITNYALDTAEKKWTTSYCVEVQVPELGTGVKSVQPNSETPFTAIVRHKFENVELQVPVIATLSDGQVSVNPSGVKVPAPATFRYKAPGEIDKTATVNLVTRSKRGIATLDVKFIIGGQAYKVDQPVPGITGNFQGLSCDSPYGPWEITFAGPDSMGMNRNGIFRIPLFVDGKANATYEDHGIYGDSGYDVVGTIEATIAPNADGYLIDFKSQTMTGTAWAGKVKSTINLTIPGYKISVIPADPGQCSQP
jgi:hypothetical protein